MEEYVYLHTNGELISKPKVVVDMDPDYFDSPFVRFYWSVTDDNCRRVLDQALDHGAKAESVLRMQERWGLDCEAAFIARHDAENYP